MPSNNDAVHVVYPEPIRAILNSHIDALLLAHGRSRKIVLMTTKKNK